MRGLRNVAAVLLFALLTACGSPDAFVSPNAQLGAADLQRIYLATDRVLAPDLSGTTQRAGALSFAQYDITIPPGHQLGQVEFSATNPNPNTSLTVAGAEALASLSDLGRTVRSQAGPLPNARNHFLAATSPVVIDIVTSARSNVLADRFPRRGVIDVAALQAERRQ